MQSWLYLLILQSIKSSSNRKMRSRTSKWFEVRVRYERAMDDGQQKKIIELYVVDALSFSEAEATITQEMASLASGEFEVKAISPATYGEVFFSDVDTDDKWYKSKLEFITIDEKTEKEKRSPVTYLVQGKSVESAVKHIQDVMNSTMIDYSIAAVNETKIMDVFEHKLKVASTPGDKPEMEQ